MFIYVSNFLLDFQALIITFCIIKINILPKIDFSYLSFSLFRLMLKIPFLPRVQRSHDPKGEQRCFYSISQYTGTDPEISHKNLPVINVTFTQPQGCEHWTQISGSDWGGFMSDEVYVRMRLGDGESE